MPKKYHKLHRQRDKHSSKTRSHRKQKKDHYVNQNLLEPIQEASKEKVRIDKNACGDYLHSSSIRPQPENVPTNRSKDISKKCDKIDKERDKIDLFEKDYIKKVEKSLKDNKLVRHSSLEKNEDSLLNKTRLLFRKEKSFNDSVQKVTDSKYETTENNGREKVKRHKHRNRKREEKEEKKIEEVEPSQPVIEHSPRFVKRKRDKSRKRKHKSKNKSPQFNKELYGRVQEVIFCHTNQVPYKMKNDKNSSEIKDLYRRLKKEKRSNIDDNEIIRHHRPQSHGDRNTKYDFNRDRSVEKHFTRTDQHIKSDHEKNKKRIKSPENIKRIVERKENISAIYTDLDSIEKYKNEKYSPQIVSKTLLKRKHGSKDLSEISAGTHETYFTFEKKYHSDYCKKHNKNDHTTKSVDRKYESNKEGIKHHNREDSHKHRKRSQENGEVKMESSKVEDEKIHQIVQGDLKNYFFNIQALIDQKLDALLQINKRKRELRKRDKEERDSHKRNRSKIKEKSSEINTSNKREKEEKKKRMKYSDKKEDNHLNRDEIVNEVLRRIRDEERRKVEHYENHKNDNKDDHDINTQHIVLQNNPPNNKTDSRKSSDKKNTCEQLNIDKNHQSRISSEEKHLHDSTTGHTHMSHRSSEKQKLSKDLRHEQSNKIHKEHYERKESRNYHAAHVLSCDKQHCENVTCRKTEPVSEKLRMTKDSLEYIRRRSSPPHELVIPVEDICSLTERNAMEFKKRHRSPHTHKSLTKEDVLLQSVPSYRTFSAQDISRGISKRDNAIISHHHNHVFSASDETMRGKYREERRGSSSPGRYTERVDIATHQKHKESRKLEAMKVERPSVSNEKHEKYMQNSYREHLRKSPPRYNVKHDTANQSPETFLDEVFLPPEHFRHHTRTLYGGQVFSNEERCFQKHEFIVQGIEPPILECTRKKSRRNVQAQKLECKLVTLIAINPQVGVKELNIGNQTQTSSKSHKSSLTDRDLVEKRKKSKRFKLYYKYSVADNAQENKDGSSDAKSIVSDSYRVVSDPSEEHVLNKEQPKEKHFLGSEVSQVSLPPPKKWNRLSTPRDSHLNNIKEEPSNISTAIQDQDYFVPLRGTKQYYCRQLTSSHSDYCFKIDKKQAKSNVSLQSNDTVEIGRCRYNKKEVHSRSDFKLNSKANRHHALRSKSDLYLDLNGGKQIIKTIFLEDTHPFVRSRNMKEKSKRTSAFKNLLKEEHFLTISCKGCQTTDAKGTEVMDTMVDDTKNMFENKEKQFQEIYKTIDTLEENIQSSKYNSPKTVDVAVSSMLQGLNVVSDKTARCDAACKTTDIHKDGVIQTSEDDAVKKLDAAIGSSLESGCREMPKRSASIKRVHDVAVGKSKVKIPVKPKTPRSKSEKPQTKDNKNYRSTAISPIRATKDAVTQVLAKSPTRRVITPEVQRNKMCVTKYSGKEKSRNTPENSPTGIVTTKVIETKKDKYFEVRPKVYSITAKSTCTKSPDRSMLQPKEHHQRTSKDVDSSQKTMQCIKIFRSEEKRAHSQMQSDLIEQILPEPAKEVGSPQSEGSTEKTASDEQSGLATCNTKKSRARIVTAAETNHDTIGNIGRENTSLKKSTSKTFEDGVRDSCLNHSPKNFSAPVPRKSINFSSNSKSIVVNTATYKCQPTVQTNIVNIESTTSSSVSGVVLQIIKRSKSLVHVRSQKSEVSRSKSEICSIQKVSIVNKNDILDTIEGSIISNTMEKYTNKPHLRYSRSKSHGSSLDRYIENKFTSRLFLTKDYKGTTISAYQRRKLYDQARRQKMKKKFRFSKMDLGPQIFEVRFLSMINQENNQQKENSHGVITSLQKPAISMNFGRIEDADRIGTKGVCSEPNNCAKIATKEHVLTESEHIVRTDLGDTLKVKEPNLIFDNDNIKDVEADSNSSEFSIVSNDVEKHFNICLHHMDFNTDQSPTSQEKEVTQIYPIIQEDGFNEEKLLDFCKKCLGMRNMFDEKMLTNITCNCSEFSKDCSACRNFVKAMDKLYISLAKYRNSKHNNGYCACNYVEQEYFPTCSGNNNLITEEPDLLLDKPQIMRELDRSLPQVNQEKQHKKNPKVEELFSAPHNKISSDSNQSAARSGHNFNYLIESASNNNVENFNSPILYQPMSCPILATNSSSFEYLYEETHSSDNEVVSRDTIFANLTRPFDQTFNFNQYNVEAPFFRTNNYESAPESIESGYASIKSRSCCSNSLTNFFKRPNIAVLFKHPFLTSKKSDFDRTNKTVGLGCSDKNIIYKEMTKNCQLYAKKVRQSSDMKLEENGDEYQEFSLKLLLGKNGSFVLESRAMSVRSARSELENSADNDIVQGVAHVNVDPANIEEQCCEISSAAPSNDDISKATALSYSQNGCKLILNNDILKTESITFLGPEMFSPDDAKNAVNKSSCNKISENLEVGSSFTMDFSLDSNNPFMSNNDSASQKFFTSLIQMYEKEMEICNRLYEDDLFENKLLSAVKDYRNEKKKNKRGRFSRFFRKKSPESQRITEKTECEIGSDYRASSRLQALASNARKCFTMLADAVKVNGNIDNEIKICGLLRLLERIENGDFKMIQNDEYVILEDEIQSQIIETYINIHDLCHREAKKNKKRITAKEMGLIKSFVIKYRIGLLSKTDIVASYISRGIIDTEDQLKAAVTFLMRTQSHEVNVKEFEEYCKFPK